MASRKSKVPHFFVRVTNLPERCNLSTHFPIGCPPDLSDYSSKFTRWRWWSCSPTHLEGTQLGKTYPMGSVNCFLHTPLPRIKLISKTNWVPLLWVSTSVWHPSPELEFCNRFCLANWWSRNRWDFFLLQLKAKCTGNYHIVLMNLVFNMILCLLFWHVVCLFVSLSECLLSIGFTVSLK